MHRRRLHRRQQAMPRPSAAPTHQWPTRKCLCGVQRRMRGQEGEGIILWSRPRRNAGFEQPSKLVHLFSALRMPGALHSYVLVVKRASVSAHLTNASFSDSIRFWILGVWAGISACDDWAAVKTFTSTVWLLVVPKAMEREIMRRMPSYSH